MILWELCSVQIAILCGRSPHRETRVQAVCDPV